MRKIGSIKILAWGFLDNWVWCVGNELSVCVCVRPMACGMDGRGRIEELEYWDHRWRSV